MRGLVRRVRHTSAFRRLQFAAAHRPYTLALAVIMPIPGVLGIILGDAVSQALENLGAGIVSRVVGAALLVGSVVTLAGIVRGKSLLEATGLTIQAAGCLTYGLGVILGLGLGGVVAGSGFIAVTVGSVLRVPSLAAAARETDQGDL